MASKQEDPLKLQYKSLVKINQRLKYISDVYYISYNNMIFMHSLVDFIEKIAVIKDSLNISSYRGIMYLPNQLFCFTKEAKVTKLTAAETTDKIILGQTDDDKATIELNKIYQFNDKLKEDDIISNNIIPQMYSRLHTIIKDVDKYKFKDISPEIVLSIIDNNLASIVDEESGILLSISKNIFHSIKKEDTLQYTILPLKDESLKNKSYVLYKKDTKEMTIYTIIAYLNL